MCLDGMGCLTLEYGVDAVEDIGKGSMGVGYSDRHRYLRAMTGVLEWP